MKYFYQSLQVPNNNNGDLRSFPFCEGNTESEIRISMQVGLPDCRELEWSQRRAAELKSVLISELSVKVGIRTCQNYAIFFRKVYILV